jgi:hypothetical protein
MKISLQWLSFLDDEELEQRSHGGWGRFEDAYQARLKRNVK